MFLTLKIRTIIIAAFLLAGFTIISLLCIMYLGIFEQELENQNLRRIAPKYQAGVVTNGIECAPIAGNILLKGGSAADAAIAALFCEGVALPQSMGLGGGFLLTIYVKETGVVETLDARETAPAAAYTNMYHGNASLASRGGLSIAVPGELKGYWELHKKYGKLKWSELIQPTIDLCRKGHLITKYLAEAFKKQEKRILKEPSMSEIFIDPSTNETWKEGSILKREKLADSLEIIASEGADALYNGSLTKTFIEDIKDRNGILTEEDLRNYRPVWQKPISTILQENMTLYTSPLPGSGVILTFILNILNGFLPDDHDSIQSLQRIVESFKFGYGRRTELGDPSFVSGIDDVIVNLTSKTYAENIRKLIYDNMTFEDPTYYGANFSIPEDHGTAHISVLAPNGDAVSVTSTINLVFGSIVRSKSTGIVLNDEMDDFSAPNITNSFGIPPSPANYIKPGKRPLSSMCPSIIVDSNGNVRLVVGAAGGSKITTSVASIIIKNMWQNKSLEDAVNEKRFHHQLFPMAIQFEEEYEKEVIDALQKLGHQYELIKPSDGFAAATTISRENGTLYGKYDPRRQGSVFLI